MLNFPLTNAYTFNDILPICSRSAKIENLLMIMWLSCWFSYSHSKSFAKCNWCAAGCFTIYAKHKWIKLSLKPFSYLNFLFFFRIVRSRKSMVAIMVLELNDQLYNYMKWFCGAHNYCIEYIEKIVYSFTNTFSVLFMSIVYFTFFFLNRRPNNTYINIRRKWILFFFVCIK